MKEAFQKQEAMQHSEEFVCAACDADETHRLYRNLHMVTGMRFFRCDSCGLIQAWQKKTGRHERQFYEDTYYDLETKTAEWVSRQDLFRGLLRKLEFHTPRRSLLDVGCGPGDFVKMAKCSGWEADGLEISYRAVKEARIRNKLDIFCTSLEEWSPPKQGYSVVCFWNVLDQLTDPRNAVKKSWQLLQDDGLIAIRVPNASFHHMFRYISSFHPAMVRKARLYDFLSFHLFSFSGRALRFLLEQNGFHRVTVLNSPPTSGSPIGNVQGLKKLLINTCKQASFGSAEAIRLLTLNRLNIAPSIIVLAHKKMVRQNRDRLSNMVAQS